MKSEISKVVLMTFPITLLTQRVGKVQVTYKFGSRSLDPSLVQSE